MVALGLSADAFAPEANYFVWKASTVVLADAATVLLAVRDALAENGIVRLVATNLLVTETADLTAATIGDSTLSLQTLDQRAYRVAMPPNFAATVACSWAPSSTLTVASAASSASSTSASSWRFLGDTASSLSWRTATEAVVLTGRNALPSVFVTAQESWLELGAALADGDSTPIDVDMQLKDVNLTLTVASQAGSLQSLRGSLRAQGGSSMLDLQSSNAWLRSVTSATLLDLEFGALPVLSPLRQSPSPTLFLVGDATGVTTGGLDASGALRNVNVSLALKGDDSRVSISGNFSAAAPTAPGTLLQAAVEGGVDVGICFGFSQLCNGAALTGLLAPRNITLHASGDISPLLVKLKLSGDATAQHISIAPALVPAWTFALLSTELSNVDLNISLAVSAQLPLLISGRVATQMRASTLNISANHNLLLPASLSWRDHTFSAQWGDGLTSVEVPSKGAMSIDAALEQSELRNMINATNATLDIHDPRDQLNGTARSVALALTRGAASTMSVIGSLETRDFSISVRSDPSKISLALAFTGAVGDKVAVALAPAGQSSSRVVSLLDSSLTLIDANRQALRLTVDRPVAASVALQLLNSVNTVDISETVFVPQVEVAATTRFILRPGKALSFSRSRLLADWEPLTFEVFGAPGYSSCVEPLITCSSDRWARTAANWNHDCNDLACTARDTVAAVVTTSLPVHCTPSNSSVPTLLVAAKSDERLPVLFKEPFWAAAFIVWVVALFYVGVWTLYRVCDPIALCTTVLIASATVFEPQEVWTRTFVLTLRRIVGNLAFHCANPHTDWLLWTTIGVSALISISRLFCSKNQDDDYHMLGDVGRVRVPWHIKAFHAGERFVGGCLLFLLLPLVAVRFPDDRLAVGAAVAAAVGILLHYFRFFSESYRNPSAQVVNRTSDAPREPNALPPAGRDESPVDSGKTRQPLEGVDGGEQEAVRKRLPVAEVHNHRAEQSAPVVTPQQVLLIHHAVVLPLVTLLWFSLLAVSGGSATKHRRIATFVLGILMVLLAAHAPFDWTRPASRRKTFGIACLVLRALWAFLALIAWTLLYSTTHVSAVIMACLALVASFVMLILYFVLDTLPWPRDVRPPAKKKRTRPRTTGT